ncbi:MAG: GNAT family N-acetyltransferase [Chloroflexi bacterium]|nr:MAG: GNAT family N-acetyltransferase [Chloroflexota bacterium]
MTAGLQIRLLEASNVEPIVAAFNELGWHKPAAQYYQYLAEQSAGGRTVLVAWLSAAFAGYLTINWQPEYPPFQRTAIPEISDFNVLPQFRRQGIGTQLMEHAEQLVAERSAVVGIGVGMYADYGAAQRLYVRRGYVPDGRGLFRGGSWVRPGEHVVVDDGLVLWLTKTLHVPSGE